MAKQKISSYDRARYAREDAEIDAENERLMNPCNDAQEDYDMRYGVSSSERRMPLGITCKHREKQNDE